MITVTSTTNAPGTTIQVHSLCLDFMLMDANANLTVRLFDASGHTIRLPQPVRLMSPTEKAAALALVANTGETLKQLIYRACAPYISAVYGITYTTV